MDLEGVYGDLYRAYGPQGWWPVEHGNRGIGGYDRRFEVAAGAILTQMVSWGNARLALAGLAGAGLLSLDGVREARVSKLEGLIRPAGFYRQKALKLKAFVAFLDSRHGGSLDSLAALPAKSMREELLSVHGVGEETADSIVLYAFGKPSFVVDAYTKRLCSCLGVECDRYSGYQGMFEAGLPRSARLWNEYHALIVRWGKDYGTGNKKTSLEARRIVSGRLPSPAAGIRRSR